MIKVKKFFLSFKYAFHGIWNLLRNEQNFLVDFVIAIVVLFFTFYFPLPVYQKSIIVLLVFLVLIMEIINSAFEKLIDVIQPRMNPAVNIIKDFMSAASLLMALAAIILGLMFFSPFFF